MDLQTIILNLFVEFLINKFFTFLIILIKTEEEKKKGIITTNWLINGRRTKVSADTYVPTYENK